MCLAPQRGPQLIDEAVPVAAQRADEAVAVQRQIQIDLPWCTSQAFGKHVERGCEDACLLPPQSEAREQLASCCPSSQKPGSKKHDSFCPSSQGSNGSLTRLLIISVAGPISLAYSMVLLWVSGLRGTCVKLTFQPSSAWK